MNQLQFLERFKQLTEACYQIAGIKNAGYANDTDPFANFSAAPTLAGVSVARGILVRMADKFMRVSNLLEQEGHGDESVSDTLMDLANYSLILLIWLEQQRKSQ
jgi:hypothetical protein